MGKLCHALEQHNISVRLDSRDIAATEIWRERLRKLIIASDVFCFFLSDNSLQSSVCEWEIAVATEHGKRVVPVLLRKGHHPYPETLARLQFIVLQRPTIRMPTTSAIDDCARSIHAALVQNIAHEREKTEFLLKASEWEANNRHSAFLLRDQALSQLQRWLARTNENEIPVLLADFAEASQVAEQQEARGLRRTVAKGFHYRLERANQLNEVEVTPRLVAAAAYLTKDPDFETFLPLRTEAVRALKRAPFLTLWGEGEMLRTPKVSAASRYVAALGAPRTIYVWRLFDRGARFTFAHDEDVIACYFAPGENHLLALTAAAICVWDLVSGKCVRSIAVESVKEMAALATGDIVCVRPDGTAFMIDPSGALALNFDDAAATGVLCPPNGTYAVLRGPRHRFGIVRPGDSTIYRQKDFEGMSLTLSRSGVYIISTGDDDGELQAWRADTGERVLLLGHDLNRVLAADIDERDGLVASSVFNSFYLSSLGASGKKEILRETDDIEALDFSPDGKKLLIQSRQEALFRSKEHWHAARRFAGPFSSPAQWLDQGRSLLFHREDHLALHGAYWEAEMHFPPVGVEEPKNGEEAPGRALVFDHARDAVIDIVVGGDVRVLTLDRRIVSKMKTPFGDLSYVTLQGSDLFGIEETGRVVCVSLQSGESTELRPIQPPPWKPFATSLRGRFLTEDLNEGHGIYNIEKKAWVSRLPAVAQFWNVDGALFALVNREIKELLPTGKWRTRGVLSIAPLLGARARPILTLRGEAGPRLYVSAGRVLVVSSFPDCRELARIERGTDISCIDAVGPVDRVVIGSADGAFAIFDGILSEKLGEVKTDFIIREISLSNNGLFVATHSRDDRRYKKRDYSVRLWNWDVGVEIFKTYAGGPSEKLEFSDSDKVLIIYGRRLRLIDIAHFTSAFRSLPHLIATSLAHGQGRKSRFDAADPFLEDAPNDLLGALAVGGKFSAAPVSQALPTIRDARFDLPEDTLPSVFASTEPSQV